MTFRIRDAGIPLNAAAYSGSDVACGWKAGVTMAESSEGAEQLATERIRTAESEAGPVLSLAGLGLSQLPESISSLTHLTRLDLSGNLLTELPEWLGELTALEALDLSGNRLMLLPPSLTRLSRLAQLDASGNRLLDVAPELALMPRLAAIELGGNPHLLTPPPDIVGQGAEAVLDYLRDLCGTPESTVETEIPTRAEEVRGTLRKALVIGVPVLVISATATIIAAQSHAPAKDGSASSVSAAQAATPFQLATGSPTQTTITAVAPTSSHGPTHTPTHAPASVAEHAPAPDAVPSHAPARTTAAAPSFPTAAPNVNLALGRHVTVSSTMGNFVASNATNGNVNSYWESKDGSAFPQTLTVDLGTVTTVGRFDFQLPTPSDWNERTQTFTILGSTNGTDFFTIRGSATYTFNANSPSADATSLTVSPVHARYIKLDFTATHGWPAAQMGELDVFS